MGFNVQSNSSVAQCVTVTGNGNPFFCQKQIFGPNPLFFSDDFTFENLKDLDARISASYLVAVRGSEGCRALLRDVLCGTQIKPCAQLTPPTDSGLCKSICNSYKESCNDDSDCDTFTVKNRSALCASGSVSKPGYLLLALLVIPTFVLPFFRI